MSLSNQKPALSAQIPCSDLPASFPPQNQPQQPGLEYLMVPRPIFDNPDYVGTGKLNDKVAIITGGDSGIGRAVSVAFAKEGADLVIVYLNEQRDAEETRELVTGMGRRCLLLPIDVRLKEAAHCIVQSTLQTFGRIDILINNAGVIFSAASLPQVTEWDLRTTFEVNVFSYFQLTQAALPHMGRGSSIVNTASAAAYVAPANLIDYSASKAAIVGFTRSLANNLADRCIRVNAVAPGIIWTPLNAATLAPERLANLGEGIPMGRPGQPYELAPVYVLLASDDGSYITGQTIHVNGGLVVSS